MTPVTNNARLQISQKIVPPLFRGQLRTFIAGEEGEVLTTTMIRQSDPPWCYQLWLQWRPKTIQRSGRAKDDTIDDSKSNQIKNQQTTRSGGARGAKGRWHDEGLGHANNNHTDQAEGGLDGNEEDKDNNDNDGGGHDSDNDDNDRFGGLDGHHGMRKGRGHYDRTKYNNQIDHRRGGEDGGDDSDDDDNDEATERLWLWWWKVASSSNGSGSGNERMLW